MPTLQLIARRALPKLSLAAFAVGFVCLTATSAAQDATEPAQPAQVRAAQPTSRLLDPSFDPSSLRDPPFSAEARHALALWHMSRGELASAAAELDALLAAAAEGAADRPLLERNRARVRELVELRNDFFVRCRDGALKLKFELGGRMRVVTVESIEADGVTFALAKGETARMAFDELTFATFVRMCEDVKLEPGVAAARALALYFAAKPYWRKSAAGGTPAEAALLEDEAALNRVLALGGTVAKLDELSRAPLAADEDSAQRTLATLSELWKAEAGAELVVERAAKLRQLGIETLARSFTARGKLSDASWDDEIHGKLERLENERVRITWSFDDPSEARDWSVLPPDPDEFGVELKTPQGDARMAVEDGALSVLGEHYWRSALKFAAPLSVTWRVVLVGPKDPSLYMMLNVSICDEGYWSRIEAHNADGLSSLDKENSIQTGYPQQYHFGVPYTVTLKHDGVNAELTSPAYPMVKAPVFGRKAGYVGLRVCTDVLLRIEELCIEGAIAPASFVAWRDAWIEKELARLGAK